MKWTGDSCPLFWGTVFCFWYLFTDVVIPVLSDSTVVPTVKGTWYNVIVYSSGGIVLGWRTWGNWRCSWERDIGVSSASLGHWRQYVAEVWWDRNQFSQASIRPSSILHTCRYRHCPDTCGMWHLRTYLCLCLLPSLSLLYIIHVNIILVHVCFCIEILHHQQKVYSNVSQVSNKLLLEHLL